VSTQCNTSGEELVERIPVAPVTFCILQAPTTPAALSPHGLRPRQPALTVIKHFQTLEGYYLQSDFRLETGQV
jgi:hypothetical protein